MVSGRPERVGQGAALVAGFAVWGIFWGGWGALLPAIKAAVAATEPQLGLALLGIALGAMAAMPAMGPLVDRIGARAVPLTLAAFGLAVLFPSWARSTPALMLSLVLLGATSGALDVALNSTVSALERAHGVRLFNLAHAAFPAAVVVTSPAIGWARQMGWDHTTLLPLLAAPAVAAAGLNAWAVSRHRDPDVTTGPTAADERTGAAGATMAPDRGNRIRTRFGWLQDWAAARLQGSGSALWLGSLAAVVLLIENAAEQWSTVYLEETLLAPPWLASLGLGLYMGLLFLGRLLAQAAEPIPEHRWIVLGGLGAALGLGLTAVAPGPAVALTGFALAGLAVAPAIPTLFRLVGRTAPAGQQGSATSVAVTLSYLGYVLSPPLTGAVAGAMGQRAAWAGLSGLGLLLAVAAPLLRRLVPVR